MHIASGMSALVVVLAIGKRLGWREEHMSPHNLSLTILGASLLWFGWFGFNSGSALASNGLAVQAFLTTQLSAAAGGLGWLFVEWKRSGRPTTLGIASGAVAGLVSITPAAGFVSPAWAIVIGFVGGIICYGAVRTKFKFNVDDSLDVVGVHGVGGLWGSIATALFASTGLIVGNWHLLKVQAISTAAVVGYSLFATFIIIKLLDKTIGIRVTESEEVLGLDISQHGESGYNIEDAITMEIFAREHGLI